MSDMVVALRGVSQWLEHANMPTPSMVASAAADEIEQLRQRLAAAEALLLRWHTDADHGIMDYVDLALMSDTDNYVLTHIQEAKGGLDE